MRYVGSKKRIAKSLRLEIEQRKGARSIYWEPFVGGCNSFSVVAPLFEYAYGSDVSPDLILMWQAAMNGWTPPTDVSPERYYELKDALPSAERGFVGFGGSFGGRWFEGYAKGGYNSDGTPRNHQAESSRAVVKRMQELSNTKITFYCADYRAGQAYPDMVVYCDPPYESCVNGKHYYNHAPFDHEAFWAWCSTQVVRNDAMLFVSEYQAPAGWTAVAEFDHGMSVSQADARFLTTERLFMHESQVNA